MKSQIRRLVREGLLKENFGYRAGDIITKAEPKSMFTFGDRHTGHFGTGFYFFGDKETANDYTKSTGDRGVTTINLDGYNLAKGTLELHELLKNVNNDSIIDKSNLVNSVRWVLSYFGKLETLKRTIEPPRNHKDFELLTPEQRTIIDKEDMLGFEISRRNKEIIGNIINDINNSNSDSASTIVMKSIGFDGVDSRGTELDNATYGSVIYDIKK